MDTPQVWIGCLAAYNAGRLHGHWVDATDADEMREAAKEIIRTSPAWQSGGHAEEWFVADYDNFPGSVVRELGEYPSFEAVENVANMIENGGEEFAVWLSIQDSGLDLDDPGLAERFEEERRGEWDSEAAYAMEVACDVGWAGLDGEQVDKIASYLDWDVIASELFRHGPYTYERGFVFEAMY